MGFFFFFFAVVLTNNNSLLSQKKKNSVKSLVTGVWPAAIIFLSDSLPTENAAPSIHEVLSRFPLHLAGERYFPDKGSKPPAFSAPLQSKGTGWLAHDLFAQAFPG